MVDPEFENDTVEINALQANEAAEIQQDTEISAEEQPAHKTGWMATFKDPQFKQSLTRLLKLIFKNYPVLAPCATICVFINMAAGVTPAIFMQRALSIVEATWKTGDWAAASESIAHLAIVMACVLGTGVIARLIGGQFVAVITQGTLRHIRNEMYERMESLPIAYFDTNAFGDIMSHYTNDVDALRQTISMSLTGITMGLLSLTGITLVMLYYSFWMTIIVIAGALIMFSSMGALGARSGKYYRAQQEALGKCEGFAEEVMAGQRTIKVFTHEKQVKEEFDALNDELFRVAKAAENYAYAMYPILFNSGNILYVIVAIAGSLLIQLGVPNVSLSGLPLTIATAIPFLNITKSFTGQISNISDSVNPLILGISGARRIFALIDEKPEEDEGYVTLEEIKDEAGHKTWAWKHPHSDGTTTFTPLTGDVVLEHVDFGYVKNQLVLKDISIHAREGQKVAFVGATGAGKTTITNLLNRFYDINDGKIRYDGINIEKIKKPELRHALGMVLQDTHLFTDSVMENIRFGRLSATDEECIEAAKLAGADSFITRLPDGYATELEEGGANLSQGQRQLISIARAAVADPPVMILDEATSSIDTRTESLVAAGMDNLMKGRTTFVIAHRLSTVKNADLICVLDHGRIIERGTHDELIAQKGTYYQLYTGAFEFE